MVSPPAGRERATVDGDQIEDPGKRLERFVVQGALLETFETRRALLSTAPVTDVADMFVRNIPPAPSTDELRLGDC